MFDTLQAIGAFFILVGGTLLIYGISMDIAYRKNEEKDENKKD